MSKENEIGEAEEIDVAAPVCAPEHNGHLSKWTPEQAALLRSASPRPVTPQMQEALRTYRERMGRNGNNGK